MLVDPKITRKWWNECLSNTEKLNKWLQKLQVTELDGYSGNFEANAKWNKFGNRVLENFLVQTGRDELKHSDYLRLILQERSLEPLEDITGTSIYWDRMEAKVTDWQEMCAVFYLGERLASERFQIISECKSTPSDIMDFIRMALPDEEMHAYGYARLAEEAAIGKMRVIHDEVIKDLLGSRLNVT